MYLNNIQPNFGQFTLFQEGFLSNVDIIQREIISSLRVLNNSKDDIKH